MKNKQIYKLVFFKLLNIKIKCIKNQKNKKIKTLLMIEIAGFLFALLYYTLKHKGTTTY